MKAKDFSALAAMKDELKEQAAQRERQKAIEAEKARKQAALANEFRKEMESLGVQKVDLSKGRTERNVEKPKPYPFQRELEHQQILKESLSDNFGIDHLLASGDRLAYHKPELAPNIPRQLYNGKWSIKGTLDLHGYTADEARLLLTQFIHEQRKQGHRAVRIIHGKGHGSVGRQPVLKELVPSWLVQKQEVQAFVQAPEHDGGSGAVLVLLSPA